MQKVLIIRLSSIGDIILTSPVIRNLKERGDFEIHYVVKSKFSSTIEYNPYIDKIWKINESVSEITDALIEEGFDYVIDLHNNIRSSQIKRKLHTSSATLDKLNIRKWIWVNTGINLMPDRHIVDRYMDTISHLGIVNDEKGLDFFIPKDQEVDLSSLSPVLRPNNYIAWMIGATFGGKKFSIEKNISILKKLDYNVVLLGGDAEISDANKIMSGVGSNVVNAVAKYTLHQSASLIHQSAMVLTPDTGMMHIAAAFKKDIISIWGCTSPGFGMSPYHPGKGSLIIEPEGLSKRPCSKLGNRCKYDGGCINRISDEAIIEAIIQIMPSVQ